jgi:hypothetical protein
MVRKGRAGVTVKTHSQIGKPRRFDWNASVLACLPIFNRIHEKRDACAPVRSGIESERPEEGD